MRVRRFAPLGIDVSVVGFGTWSLGGEIEVAGRPQGWGPTDRGEALRAVRRALDLGIDFFDTSDAYGEAETLLGEGLAGARAIVCTKFGNRPSGQDFSEACLLESVEGSLRRLRRDRLDVLLLHSPPEDFAWSDYDPTPLDRLVAAGKLGCYGVSCRTPRAATRVLEARFGRVLEVAYNASDRRAEVVFAEAVARGVAIIARTPLGSGFLAATAGGAPFGPTDYRSTMAPEELAWRVDAARRLAFLDALPGGRATSALRFVLSAPAVTTAIPGMRRVAHVEANAAAAELGPLDEDAIRAVHSAVPEVYKAWLR